MKRRRTVTFRAVQQAQAAWLHARNTGADEARVLHLWREYKAKRAEYDKSIVVGLHTEAKR